MHSPPGWLAPCVPGRTGDRSHQLHRPPRTPSRSSNPLTLYAAYSSDLSLAHYLTCIDCVALPSRPPAQYESVHSFTAMCPLHAAIAGDNVIGCFQEPTMQPDGTCLPSDQRKMTFLGIVAAPVSHKACAGLAAAANMRYYAPQYGKQCFGSNSIQEYTAPGTCNTACLNNPSQQWWVDVPLVVWRHVGGGSSSRLDAWAA